MHWRTSVIIIWQCPFIERRYAWLPIHLIVVAQRLQCWRSRYSRATLRRMSLERDESSGPINGKAWLGFSAHLFTPKRPKAISIVQCTEAVLDASRFVENGSKLFYFCVFRAGSSGRFWRAFVRSEEPLLERIKGIRKNIRLNGRA